MGIEFCRQKEQFFEIEVRVFFSGEEWEIGYKIIPHSQTLPAVHKKFYSKMSKPFVEFLSIQNNILKTI